MPRLTSLSGAQVAVLFDDPLGIVEFDEVADGIPQLRDVAVDATMDDLFLQRAIEPLGDAVGTQSPKESPYFRNALAILFGVFEISLHLGLFDSERCTRAAYI